MTSVFVGLLDEIDGLVDIVWCFQRSKLFHELESLAAGERLGQARELLAARFKNATVALLAVFFFFFMNVF